MNHQYGCTVIAAPKKPRRSSAALALLVGLALLLPGAAALAGEPIPGVDVELGKNPGGIAVTVPTGADGAYQVKGLAPGNYDLFVGGQRVQTISVGDKGSISGVLSRELDGKASITFDGQVGVVPDLPSAPISTSHSNIKHPSKVAENESPRPTNRKISADPTQDGGDVLQPRKVEFPVPTQDGGDIPGKKHTYVGSVTLVRGTAPRPGEGEPDGPQATVSSSGAVLAMESITITGVDDKVADGNQPFRASLPPKGGDKTPPGIATGIAIPIAGIPVRLEGDPGSVRVGAKTEQNDGVAGIIIQPPILGNDVGLAAPGSDGGGVKPGIMDEANSAMSRVSTTRGRLEKPDDPQKPGTSDQGSSGGLSSYGTAPPLKGRDDKLPSKLRVINNSETDTATVEAINGIGGTGGGRFTFKPTSRVAGSANVDSSNRDHIDQDAQADIKKSTAVQPGGTEDAGIRVTGVDDTAADGSQNVTVTGVDDKVADGNQPFRASLPPKGGDKTPPGIATPISGIPVGLEGDPGSIKVSTTTDEHGAFNFANLPAGKYKLILPDKSVKSITIDAGGTTGGKVMRSGDGVIVIGDFEGPAKVMLNSNTTIGVDTGSSKAAGNPVGFGSGNNPMGAGPGAPIMGGAGGPGPGMNPMSPSGALVPGGLGGGGVGLGGSPGMSLPGAPMGGAGGPGPGMNPMSPGAGGPMGGSPGGAMRP